LRGPKRKPLTIGEGKKKESQRGREHYKRTTSPGFSLSSLRGKKNFHIKKAREKSEKKVAGAELGGVDLGKKFA